MTQAIVQIKSLTQRYRQRLALDQLSLEINAGEIFSFLGPNGSGKTTLFRVLSTLIPPDEGNVSIAGLDVRRERAAVRRLIGVVFQSPSLDKQLTAAENLRHHGHLYGLRGPSLETRLREMLDAVKLADRMNERVGGFSGGMRRRVELAKGMLTQPRILLLDEPSTGLDPSARIDLWEYLSRVRREQNVTVLLTTHLMDEADQSDRVAILDSGKLLACDTPDALKSSIGGDVITLRSTDPAAAAVTLRERLLVDARVVDGAIHLEQRDGHALVPRLIESLPPLSVTSIAVGKPTLEDVFVRLTGHRFKEEMETPVDGDERG